MLLYLTKEAQGKTIIQPWQEDIPETSCTDLDVVAYEEKKTLAGFALKVYHASLGKADNKWQIMTITISQ